MSDKPGGSDMDRNLICQLLKSKQKSVLNQKSVCIKLSLLISTYARPYSAAGYIYICAMGLRSRGNLNISDARLA